MRAVSGFRRAALVLTLAVAAVPGPAQTNEGPSHGGPTYDAQARDALRRMASHAQEERWTSALAAAREAGGGPARDAYEWLRLRDREPPNFARVSSWLARKPGWPSAARIQANGERLLREERVGPSRIVRFFEANPPITGTGALAYAEALLALDRADAARAVALRAWVEEDFDAEEEQRMLERFGAALAPLHDRRLDRLIWTARLTAAERQLPRASRDAAALGRTRIALMRGASGVDPLVAATPSRLKADPGLAYARMYWRYKRGLRESAEEMMLQSSRAGNLGRAEKWADERALFVREALDDGRARRAYDLAAGHGLERGAAYADLEWLAGWIALRRLQRPDLGYRHFSKLYDTVSTPVSRSRAAYWAGEAAAALDKDAEAARWRALAADHPDAFYGQRAARALGRPLSVPPALPARPGPCLRDPRLAVGDALALGGAQAQARLFYYDVAETCETPAQVKALGEKLLALGATRVAVGLARLQRRDNVLMPEISHPIAPIGAHGCGGRAAPERALTLALARQESGFDSTARSPAGARGLMQVMPGTAKRTAPEAGLSYNLTRLESDPEYNARIGQCYLAQMLERFEGSYPMAIAAYNAGPSRVGRWVARHGRPTPETEIDWIERIPFAETRNYVQRVLESLEIYRLRLGA